MLAISNSYLNSLKIQNHFLRNKKKNTKENIFFAYEHIRCYITYRQYNMPQSHQLCNAHTCNTTYPQLHT